MNWNNLQFFLHVARQGTLSRASRQMRVDATTISRRVAALEGEVRRTLFERTGDGWVLTQDGRALLPLAEEMERAAGRIDAATADSANLGGVLRVSVSEGFGASFVAPRLGQFAAQHPALAIDLVASSGFLNPSRREADLAILLARPRKGPLVTRKLADYELGLFAPASRTAWHEQAADQPIRTLGIPVVGYVPDLIYTPELRYLDEIEPGLEAQVRSTSINAQLAMIRGGAGIGVLPCFMAEHDPDLVRILPDRRIMRSFWLSVHRDVASQPRVRLFIDWLAEALRDHAALMVPGG